MPGQSLAEGMALTTLKRDPAVVLAASVGGHLAEAIWVRDELAVPVTLVSTQPDNAHPSPAGTVYVPKPRGVSGRIANALTSLILAVRLRPDLTVGFGSGGVAWFCLWSRILGAKLVTVETFARVNAPSRFVRALSTISWATLVQWPALAHRVPRAVVVKPILESAQPRVTPLKRVFVVVGTHPQGMDRLIQLVDCLWPLPGGPEVLYQIGNSRVIPRHGSWYRWKTSAEFAEDIAQADLVICHDGASTILQALHFGKPIVVVPRNRTELDYVGDSQLAKELGSRHCIIVAETSQTLESALNSLDTIRPLISSATETIPAWLQKSLTGGV